MSNAGISHTDASGRFTRVDGESDGHDRFLRPCDGKTVPLLVQSFEDPKRQPRTNGWTRIGKPQNQVSPIVKLTYWVWSSSLQEGSEARKLDRRSTCLVVLKWIVSWPLFLVLLCMFQTFEAPQVMLNGSRTPNYPPVPDRSERYFDEPRTQPRYGESSESGEDESLLPTDPASSESIRLSTDLSYLPRLDTPSGKYRPRFLCFLRDAEELGSQDQPLYETRNVSEWIEKNGGHADTDYVFVSYTKLQFRVAAEEEIATANYPNEEIRAAHYETAKKDRETLINCGIEAARSAGKKAFWLDFECTRDENEIAQSTSAIEDVYHTCDVIRASHSMIIVVGPSISSWVAGDQQPYNLVNETIWLQEWSSRLWALPEILLSPSQKHIKLYTIGNSDGPKQAAKRTLAKRAFADVNEVGTLVDHYEGSVRLTTLQLIGIALECFSRRKEDQWVEGDVAYVLMGLLPQKYHVSEKDPGFQAFARLSLTSGSNHLLERLLCILPLHKDATWHDTKDVWGAKLWDIDASCQVTKVVDEQTISLDGGYGATIHWDCLDPLHSNNETEKSSQIMVQALGFAGLAVVAALYLLFVAHILSEGGARDSVHILRYIAAFLFFIAVLMALVAPRLILTSRLGILGNNEARFIGIEGHVDIGTVESHLLGFNHGRLVESGNSPAQRYHDNAAAHPGVDEQPGSERLLTLVDTHTMTVTRFYAERPPVAIFICGKDRDMQRALLCSYDWESNIFCRETILRMRTAVLSRMEPAGKIHMSLKRPSREPEVRELQDEGEEELLLGQVEPSVTPTLPLENRGHLRRVDVILVPLMWFVYGAPVPFILDQRKVFTFIYCAAFLVMQIPTFLLLRQSHIGRTISIPIFLKGVAILLIVIRPDSISRVAVMQAVRGIADGIIIPAFVVLTCSWYTPRELPVRLIIWISASQVIPSLMFQPPQDGEIPVHSKIICGSLAALCMAMSVYTYKLIGTPSQIRWLPAYERMVFAKLSAAHVHISPWLSDTPWTRFRLTGILKDRQTHLLFLISLLNSTLNAMPTPGTSIWLPAGISATIVTAAVGTIVWRFRIPSTALIFSSHTLATASIAARQTMQAATFPLNSGIAWFFFLHLPAMLLSLQTVVQPFLWTLVAVNVPDPDARLATLGAVFAGYAVGKGFCVGASIYASPWRWVPVAFVQQLAIGGLVVFYMWRNGEAEQREGEQREGEQREGERREVLLGAESGDEGGEEGLEGKQFRYAY